MSLRCLVIVGLFFAAKAAVIQSRNIPVEVVYDKTNPIYYGNRNLDAKIQLSSDELLKLKLSDEIIHAPEESVSAQISEMLEAEGVKKEDGVKNLEEKVQLSPEETAQVQFVPAEEIEQSTAVKQAPLQNNKVLLSLLKKAEETAYSGISTLRINAEQASQAFANVSNGEMWEKLNQTLDNFFKDQYRHVSLKADNENNNQNNNENNQVNQFWQSFVNNFQNTVNNWMNNTFQQNNEKPAGSEDEQGGGGSGSDQNPFQNFFTSFSSGFSNIVNNINNLNNQNAPNGTSGDTGEGGGANGGNIFNNVVSSIQQFFSGGSNQGNNPIQGIGANQSDTGVQPPANQGFFQGAINQFQGVINNFRPSSQATQAPVQGDEGTSTTQASNIFGNINQAFQNVNFSGNPLGQLPGQGSGGQGGFPNPQQIGSQISNQIGQFAGGQGGQGGSNPIDPQAIGSQIGNQIGQFGQGGSGGSNPLNPQSIGSQIGSQIGQFGGGQGGQGGSNPIDPQAIGSQIGNQIGQFGQGGNNPIQSIQNAISGSSGGASSTEASKTKNEMVEALPGASLEVKLEEKKPAEVVKKE